MNAPYDDLLEEIKILREREAASIERYLKMCNECARYRESSQMHAQRADEADERAAAAEEQLEALKAKLPPQT